MRAGVSSVLWMCLCVRRTATNGLTIVRTISPVRLTGTRDGTGAQVSTHIHIHIHTERHTHTNTHTHTNSEHRPAHIK